MQSAPAMGTTQPALPATQTGAFALGIVGGLAILRLAVHLALNNRYDFHRDEMALVDYARHLDWGFVEFPPLTPALARASMVIFGESVWGARVYSALAMALVVLMAGWMARDLGGKRGAQALAAAGACAALFSMLMGSMTQYASLDYFWWVAVVWALLRRKATGNLRWWLAVGIFIGLGMMTKYTMAILAVTVLAAVLLSDLRRDLLTPWPWAGAALALLIMAPNLVWQARHGWVAFEFTAAIHARDIEWGRTQTYWIEQLLVGLSPLLAPLWITGLIRLLVAKSARPYLFLAWLYLLPLVAFGILQGRPYYMAATYVWLGAAGAVAVEAGIERLQGGWRRAAPWAAGVWVGLAMVGGVLVATPVAPVNSGLWNVSASLHDIFREQMIWPELAQTVAKAYTTLPEEQKPRTTIITGNYGEAGALNWYGPALGLPRAISGVNTYWLWGYGDPANPPELAIVVGWPAEWRQAMFTLCVDAGKVPNPQEIENEETNFNRSIYMCTGPRMSWAEAWPKVRDFG